MNAFDALVATYRETCIACPTQYEGTLKDGRVFYFRYRHGRATLGLGADEHAAVCDPSTVGIRFEEDHLSGYVTEDEFKDLFVRLMECRDD
jgi:hypothetical protein